MRTEQMKLDGLAWEIKLKARLVREFPDNPGLAEMYFQLLCKNIEIDKKVYGLHGPPPVEELGQLIPSHGTIY